ncbi:uncharacterized protein BDZ99DRAFT_492414 [Mytilinidion resinicola]|uniref:Uncharacterized protein n=1 Tax=Mytilinidion resinicola TaxID=574789 RepID=A0A6A6XZ84_9PEZI|nr:uncharacterized protein BDZ99DRAFT_492414 [Mytilinidion resinicola]KAF2801871.1 hypothetical protein BDZ99DRAFT_492414 [Mytilinidion resinicola]
MSLDTLEPGGLYVVLFIQNVPPPKDDFHWGLYLHKYKNIGGTKYHIWDPDRDWVWVADHGMTTGLFKSHALVGLFQIARVSPEWECEVDRAARSFDDSLNQRPGIGCDVWLFWTPAPGNGTVVLKCKDLEALKAEILDFANQNAQAAAKAVRPRPIIMSRLCGL